jgi:uncharacterized membrane protein YhiD involved in acid resistance
VTAAEWIAAGLGLISAAMIVASQRGNRQEDQ